MIEEMRLRDLGVIAEAHLPIGPGFTAVTGETGAGKTMVVTGLGLLMGDRADSGAVRQGATQAAVEGVWIVPADGAVAARVNEAGGDLDSIGGGLAELHIGRTLSAEGRSRATVGGRQAPAGVLSDLADQLVVVHGQSEQVRLRTSAAQRNALDRFGGPAVRDALRSYRAAFDTWRSVAREAAELRGAADVRAAEAARLRDALAEIEELAPEPAEDEELAARAERLGNLEGLRFAASAAREAVASELGDDVDASVRVSEARRALERVGDDPVLQGLGEQLAEVGFRLSEIAVELSAYLADLDGAGPYELEAVNERRAAITALARKHGPSLDAVLALQRDGALRLLELDGDDERIAELEQSAVQLGLELDDAAARLTAARRTAAAKLGAAVTEELHSLAMPDATLAVEVTEAEPTADGRDEVALLLSPHTGASPRAVSKGASGGELSRVMLAIEVVIAATDPVPTFVFDEVDAGVGGAAAIEIGRRLARLAEASQVIVVTHLAQVAAFANNHLSVVKTSDGSVTASSVRRLEGADREAEMARLLSGLADSESALTHARELLELAHTER